MKQTIFFLTLLLSVTSFTFSQDRGIARGATPGELYLSEDWYGIYYGGPPYYSTLRSAIYRLTENGKKLTKQYDADCFANPEVIMQTGIILADATSGVVYNKGVYFKNEKTHTTLWVSFDYGKNWTFREENIGSYNYYSTNFEGLIYRQGSNGAYKSEDYGLVFSKSETSSPGPEPGLINGEAFGVSTNLYNGKLTHTYNFYETYTTISIDSQFVCCQIWGVFPDVYRGGLPGEVYVSSMFPYGNQYNPDVKYKVSFSADTGHTFRHVYESEFLEAGGTYPTFMSDREPGVFYIVRKYEIEDKNPWGWHTKICVEYYRDYGETLVATYCHDITKDYENEVGIKPITNDELRITVYPNPAFSTVTIEANNFSKVEIYNIFGQLLQIAKTQVVDVSAFNAGVYFFKVFDVESNSVVKRVVVVR